MGDGSPPEGAGFEERMPKGPVWFIVADAGLARLLQCTRVPRGRWHVDELDALRNHTEEHEHGRPSPLAGRGGSYASGGHESEQQLHRFAKEVAAWIESKLEQHGIDRVVLFSAPRFLGELRKLYGNALAGRVREEQADLTHLTPAGLARHRAVERLLSEA